MPTKRVTNPIVLAAAVGLLLGGCHLPSGGMKADPDRAYIDAWDALRRSAESDDPITRVHALEAMAQTLGAHAGYVYVQALGDRDYRVRYAAAMAVGETRHAPAKAHLLRMAGDKAKAAEPDKRVFCAVLCALYRLGNDDYAGQLGKLLFDREAEVRAAAAAAMGKMAEPSAIGPLRTQLSDEQDVAVQMQIVESLALLGDARSAVIMEAYAKTPFIDEQLAAIPALARLRSKRSLQTLSRLMSSRRPPRIRAAAAAALARAGQPSGQGYKLCLNAVRDPEKVMRKSYGKSRGVSRVEINSLRRLAAISLGWMRRPVAVDALFPLLGNVDGGVRVAAAMSMLRLLTPLRPKAALRTRAPRRPAPRQTKKQSKRPRMHTTGGKD